MRYDMIDNTNKDLLQQNNVDEKMNMKVTTEENSEERDTNTNDYTYVGKVVKTEYLNVRDNASMYTPIVTILNENDVVKISDSNEIYNEDENISFYKINVNGKEGYVLSNYIEIDEQ